MSVRNIIEILGGLAGSFIAIISFFAIFKKPINTWRNKRKAKKEKAKEIEDSILQMRQMIEDHMRQDKEQQDLLALHGEALLCLLRGEITHTYYKYLPNKQIPSYEKENLIKQHDSYHALQGDTYIDTIYPEMMTWETIT